jgi:glutaminase
MSSKSVDMQELTVSVANTRMAWLLNLMVTLFSETIKASSVYFASCLLCGVHIILVSCFAAAAVLTTAMQSVASAQL